MASELSHGKARTTLPRSSDLGAVPPAAAEPSGSRGPDGRFAAGNGIGRGKGAKMVVAKLLGKDCDDPAAIAVANDARLLFAGFMRELPHDSPGVRALVAQRARHEALSAYWTAVAAAAGLNSDEGVAAADQATKHGVRAERLAVTSLDIATRLATAKPKALSALDVPYFVQSKPETGK